MTNVESRVVSCDITAFLANHALFRHLTEHERLDLANNSKRKEFHSGEFVFAKGDPPGALYIVLQGSVVIGTYSADGHKIIYDVLRHGDNFGEVSAIDGNVHTADATTLEDSELLIIRRTVFVQMITHNAGLALSLLESICRRLRSARALLDDMYSLDLPSRLAKRVLVLAEKQEAFEQPRGLRVCHLSQYSLASMIGASRQTVNKMLRDWERQGIIELHREEIIVYDATRLRHIADSGIS